MSLIMGVCRLDENAVLPTKAHEDDLGWDLCAVGDATIIPNGITKVRTGIAVQFPQWCGGLIRDRSGVATKLGIFVVAGVIDPSYIGEVIVAFQNPSGVPVEFKAGDRIAQMIITPVIPVEVEEITELTETTRGASGFGSSGS